jgi:hypothetical protein
MLKTLEEPAKNEIRLPDTREIQHLTLIIGDVDFGRLILKLKITDQPSRLQKKPR